MPFFGFGYSASSTITQSSISAGGTDSDAQAFIDAAGITDSTQQTAINQLVLDLKSYNIWTKMKAVYPIVGGTSTTHKFNLVNPADTDAAFRLSFSTGWTHSSTGMTPNGSSAFADTFLAPTSMDQNSIHGSVYLRLNNNVNGPAFASEVASTYANGFYLFPKQTAPGQYSVRINDSTSEAANNPYDIRGTNIITRTASNSKKYRVNTNSAFSVTTASTARHTDSIYIAKARNNANYYTNEYAFLSFGDGLSDTECNNLVSAVATFNTTLGRNV